jgi:hypothetical protein
MDTSKKEKENSKTGSVSSDKGSKEALPKPSSTPFQSNVDALFIMRSWGI